MKNKLHQLNVAVLLCDGFEEVEMTSPRSALKKSGINVVLISPAKNKVKAWQHDHWSKTYPIDVTLTKAKASDYDALVLPGGVMNPDKLRLNKRAITFIKSFLNKNKIVAAICHGPWTLIETKNIRGRKMTSYPSIKTDLINAGVKWQNKKVIIDKNLITSRKPDDLPAFNRAIINSLRKKIK